MSTTNDVSKVPADYKHFTKLTPFSTKLEWRIDHFDKAMQFYELDQSIAGKTFSMAHFQAVWQLDVYPYGKNGNCCSNGYVCPYFSLRLIGFQTPGGSLSQDKTKSIKPNYKIYVRSSANEEKIISQGLRAFQIGTLEGSCISNEKVKKFIHPDGSLLVICEVECLSPEETFSVEPSLSPDLLNPNLQIADHIGEMWKSKLFTDCTVKVGAKSFPAHKCILGQCSEVFRKMFSLPLEEAESGIVEIDDFSSEAIAAMLEYMYTMAVKHEVMEKLAPEILALADKYAVIPLKDMCEIFLAFQLTTENFLEIIILADRFSAAKLKKACANRFAIDGRASLQSEVWKDLKSKDKDLANELLELLIQDQPCFADVPKKKEQKEESEDEDEDIAIWGWFD